MASQPAWARSQVDGRVVMRGPKEPLTETQRDEETRPGLLWTLLEDCEVALGVGPVQPLLVEHDRQALLDREGAGRGPTVVVRRGGLGGERLLGEALDDAAYVGLSGAAEHEDLVQGAWCSGIRP